jgi:DNA-binding MarR family transcriptional regulator
VTDIREPEVVRLNNMVCFNLNAAARAVTAVYRSLLEPLGVTYPQYLVLASLWEYGDLSVGEMARLLQLDYGTMTPLLKRMEKQGLVHRTRNPEDERTVIVTLAPEGEALRTHAPRIYQAICETFDFTPERAAAAQLVLQPIIDRANQATGIVPLRKG